MSLLDYAPTPPEPTGCAFPKMRLKRKACGCVSTWTCEACGYQDRRQEAEHGQLCRREER